MKNVLLIGICKEKLGFYEFVKPVGDILIKNKIKGIIRHYGCLTKKDLEMCDGVIICGTTLFDSEFIDNVSKFDWLKEYKKPVLGICGGMQIIGLAFGGKLARKTEIGYYTEVFGKTYASPTSSGQKAGNKEEFIKKFLGLRGRQEVYHLHNNYIDFSKLDFEVFAGKKISQAVKHKSKEIYGVLFHPEVRQKMMIEEFCNLK